MKNLITFLLLTTILSISCTDKSPKVDPATEIASVQNVLTSYFNAISEKNWDNLKAVSTDDFVLFESGKIWNNDSLIALASTFPESTKILYKLENLKTEVCDSLACMYYNDFGNILTDTTEMKIHWIESATFKKTGNSWKISFLHSTMAGQPEMSKREY